MFCARQGIMLGTGDLQRAGLICPKSAEIFRTDRGRILLEASLTDKPRHFSVCAGSLT
jgi:hypothetical protein